MSKLVSKYPKSYLMVHSWVSLPFGMCILTFWRNILPPPSQWLNLFRWMLNWLERKVGVGYTGKLQEICPEILKQSSTGWVLAPFVSPFPNCDWPDGLLLSHMAKTFIFTHTPQQPPEPDLVMLKVGAIHSSKKSGCTLWYSIQTQQKTIKYASKNALIMKRCYVKILLRYYLKKKKKQKQRQCQYSHFWQSSCLKF